MELTLSFVVTITTSTHSGVSIQYLSLTITKHTIRGITVYKISIWGGIYHWIYCHKFV